MEEEGEEDAVRGGHHVAKRARKNKSVVAVFDDAARTYVFVSPPSPGPLLMPHSLYCVQPLEIGSSSCKGAGACEVFCVGRFGTFSYFTSINRRPCLHFPGPVYVVVCPFF